MMLVKMFLEIFNLMVNIDGYRDEDSWVLNKWLCVLYWFFDNEGL